MTATVEQVHEDNYSFSMNDRCDADKGSKSSDGRGIAVSEQAYHRWTKDGMEVFFCAHHNRKYGPTLFADGWKCESDVHALQHIGDSLDINR